MERTSYYIIASSKDDPDWKNGPTQLQVTLKDTLTLGPGWKAKLVHSTIPHRPLLISCDIVEDSYVGTSKLPLLCHTAHQETWGI